MKRILCLSLLIASCSPETEPSASEADPSLLLCQSAIHYRSDPSRPPLAVHVIGDFNDWQVGATSLEDLDGNGDYLNISALAPGDYLYELWVDGERRLDKTNPLTGFQPSGRESSFLRVEDCTKPSWALTSRQWSKQTGLTLKVLFEPGRAGGPLDPETVEVTVHHLGAHSNIVSVRRNQLELNMDTAEFGRGIVEVSGSDPSGNTSTIKIPFWTESAPFQWQDAIIYQVMIDRFRSSDGPIPHDVPASFIHGGNLDGVTEAIESGYFDDLGVNVIWLSPVIDNPEGQFIGRDGHLAESYHGYWPSRPRTVEERMGGREALERLVSTAHRRGIRVIIDHVLNHIHTEHPYYLDDEVQDWINHPEGDCICGFSCSWATHIQDCWFDPFLADLKWQTPRVAQTQIDDALFWLEHFNLDGFRLDAVPMMPRMAIRRLRAQLNERLGHRADDYYLLGETYTGAFGQNWIRYYLGEHSLSGQFDFPVMWTLRSALSGQLPMSALADQMLLSQSSYADSGAVMAPLMGNHDVGRIISALNGDDLYQPRELMPDVPCSATPYERLKMAWTFIMTQPGAPVIYYGDEIGLPGANDPDNRRPMRFDTELSALERDVLAHTKYMGMFRKTSPALRRGHLELLHADDDTLVYARTSREYGSVIVALNRSLSERELTIAWDPQTRGQISALLGAQMLQSDTELVLTLEPLSSDSTTDQGDYRD